MLGIEGEGDEGKGMDVKGRQGRRLGMLGRGRRKPGGFSPRHYISLIRLR